MNHKVTLNLQVEATTRDRIDMLSARWAIKFSQPISRSKLVRFLLEDSLNRSASIEKAAKKAFDK